MTRTSTTRLSAATRATAEQLVEQLRSDGDMVRADAVAALVRAATRGRSEFGGSSATGTAPRLGGQERTAGRPAGVGKPRRRDRPLLGDLLTSTQAGDLIGVSGQTIKRWVKEGRFQAYRIGARVMVPREVVEEYVRLARPSLDLDDVSGEEAARLVREVRRGGYPEE